LPINFSNPVVSVGFPCSYFGLHGLHIGNAAIKALPFQGTEFNLRHIEPTAMFRSVMNIKALCQPPGLLGIKRFIQRCYIMCIQIVHNKPYFHCVRVTIIKHFFYLLRPVFSGAALGHRDMSLPGQRFHFHEYFRNTLSDIFIVHAFRAPRFAWYRITNLTDQLLTRFIHANYRIAGVIGHMVDFQNIFHGRYEGRTSLWRDLPVFAEVRFKFIFFKARCIVMCETDGTMFSSTILSARSLTVHRWYPSGASEQAKARSLASNAPSKTTSRGGFSLGLRSSATSRPSSTKRFFKCSIVRDVIPNASATSAFFQAGPSGPASQSNNARARMNLLAWVFPRRVNASSSFLSWSVNVTRYLGDMAASLFGLLPAYHKNYRNEILNVTWY